MFCPLPGQDLGLGVTGSCAAARRSEIVPLSSDPFSGA